jgi:hypothetical protein
MQFAVESLNPGASAAGSFNDQRSVAGTARNATLSDAGGSTVGGNKTAYVGRDDLMCFGHAR